MAAGLTASRVPLSLSLSGCGLQIINPTGHGTLPGALALRLVSVAPPSPSNGSQPPLLLGTTSPDVSEVKLFLDPACLGTMVGKGSAVDFGSVLGVSSQIPSNIPVTLYAIALDLDGHASGCQVLTTYLRDTVPPATPVWTALIPASPSASLTPLVRGTASADTTSLNFFLDAACTTRIGTGGLTLFAGAGIPVNVPAGQVTSIYVQALDLAGNASPCSLLTSNQNTLSGVAPTLAFSSGLPLSPSPTSTTPTFAGTSSASVVNVTLYSDSLCSSSIGTGTNAAWSGAGIPTTVSANATTSVYGQASDGSGGLSACTALTSYTHDSVPPAIPSFLSTSPGSPSNSSTTPAIKGQSSADTTQVSLFSNVGCSASLASGTKAQWEGAGIGITVSANTTTSIYAKSRDAAGNLSACTLLTSYTHDSTALAGPTLTSITPASPSRSVTTPVLQGTAPASTVSLGFYSNASCTLSLGGGTRAQWTGGGIALTVPANATTSIYTQGTNASGTLSSCGLLTNYTHDSVVPANPSLASTNPSSPSQNAAPLALGSSSADTVSVSVYRDASCTLLLGSGTKAQFEGAGIALSVPANTSTPLYLQAQDPAGNPSACVSSGMSYVHDTVAPQTPTFVAATPVSPSSSSTTPQIQGGGLDSDVVTVKVYSVSGCASGLLATATAAQFTASPGVSVTVAANATTSIYGQSIDGAGNLSTCTLLTSFTHDSSVPAAPAFLTFTPASPSSTSTTPTVQGTLASSGVTQVRLYSDSVCTTTLLGSGTAAQFVGNPGISLSVTANAATPIYALAQNGAGTVSACSLIANYRHDSTAPLAVTTLTHVSAYNSLTQSPPITWSGGGTDVGGSGVSHFEISLGLSAGGTTVQGWTSVGVSTSAQLTGLSLTAGTVYYANVRVIDQAGNTSSVTSSSGWTATSAALTLTPATVTLAVGNSKNLSTSGGQPPYTYSLASGSGSVDAQSGLYTAPGTPGSASVQVTDQIGATALNSITINPALTLNPSSITITVNAGQTYTFQGQNGVPGSGDTYAVTSGPGSVGSSSGVYTPGSTSGLSNLKVQDSLGNSATSQVQNIQFRTNGLVAAAVTDGVSWYLGGDFTTVNPIEAPGALVVDTSTGNPVLGCDWKSGFNGGVSAAVVSGTSLYVGGNFTTYQGQPAQNLAKLSATTCVLDTTFTQATGANSSVKALALSGTTLYIGGGFSTYRGTAAQRLAKVDAASGALDTTFTQATGANNLVYALALSGGSLYVGGNFTTYRGAAAQRLAKVDATSGALDTTFTQATGASASVFALTISGTSLYVGGFFTAYRGTAASCLAKVDAASGALDTTFTQATGTDNQVNALALSGTSLYVGGNFTTYRGTALQRLAKVDTTSGTLDTTFTQATGAGGQVLALALSGTSLYVGGNFTTYRGTAAQRLAKVDSTSGASDPTFTQTTGANNLVNALALSGTSLYFGGNFTTYRGTAAQRLAKVDATSGTVDTTFTQATGADNSVYALTLSGTSLYVGGNFSTYRGTAANDLAKVDATSGVLDTTFTQATGAKGSVNALALSGTSLYFGGGFTTYQGTAAQLLAKVDATSGVLDTTFTQATGPNGSVFALALSGTSLYIGGFFTAYRGTAANYLAKVDTTSGTLNTTFTQATGANSQVNTFALSGTSLYVGGNFSTYRGTAANYMAKVDTTSGNLDTTFTQATGPNNFVYALALSGASLYVGGNFSTYRGNRGYYFIPLSLTSGACQDP